jgi:hypothetical protein
VVLLVAHFALGNHSLFKLLSFYHECPLPLSTAFARAR